MTTIVVRDAVAADAQAMGRAHVLAWQHAYRGMMSDEYLDGLNVADRVEMWEQTLAAVPPPPLLVVEVDGEVAGFAVFGAERVPETTAASDPAARVGELYAINLHPDHWGRGAGRILLRAATDRLTDLGFSEAVLWVVTDNRRARRLYESEGWVDDDAVVTDEVLGGTVREMRYRRRLD